MSSWQGDGLSTEEFIRVWKFHNPPQKCSACEEVWPLQGAKECPLCSACIKKHKTARNALDARVQFVTEQENNHLLACRRKLAADVQAMDIRMLRSQHATNNRRGMLRVMCRDMQRWSMDVLEHLLDGVYLLASEAFPLLEHVAKEFQFHGDASNAFQCCIAGRVVDPYNLVEMVNSCGASKFSGVMRCYHLGADMGVAVVSTIPTHFRLEQANSFRLPKREEFTPVSSHTIYQLSVTLLVHICRENDLPHETIQHVCSFFSIEDWTHPVPKI